MRRFLILTIFLYGHFLSIGQDSLNYFLKKGDSLQGAFEDAKAYLYYDSASRLALRELDIPTYVRTLIEKGYSLRFDFDNPNYDGAYQYLFEALSLSRNNDLITMQQKQRIYYGLAITERVRLNYDKAMEYGELALILAERLKDSRLIAKCHNMMGNIYSTQRRYGEAIEFFKRAINIRTAENPIGDRELPYWYSNLALTFKRSNDPGNSNKYYEKSLESFSNLRPYDSSTVWNTYQDMATNYVDLNDMEQAKYYYNLASKRDISSSEKGFSSSDRFMFLGMMYKKFNRRDSALYFLQQSIIAGVRNFNPSTDLQNPTFPDSVNTWILNPEIYLGFDGKGRVLLDLYTESGEEKYLISAHEIYQLAAQLIASLRFGLEDDSPSLHLAEHAKEIYSNALRASLLMYELKKDPGLIESAFRYIEGIKQSILFRNRMIDNQAGELKEFKNEVLLIQKNIDEVRQQIELAKIEESSGYQNIETLISKVILLRSEKELVRRDSKVGEEIEYEIGSVSDVQDYLSNEQVMINYFWGSESLFGIAISRSGSWFLELDAKDLDRQLNAYIQSVSTLDFDSARTSFQNFVRSSHAVYTSILSPFLTKLREESKSDIKELIIVPDGKLNMLPFASLLSERTNDLDEVNYRDLAYLIKDYTVSYAFSASILTLNSTTDYKSGNLLAFSSNELAGTQNELERIKSIWNEVSIFNAEKSTETSFKQNAKNYNIIHIASHATSGSAISDPNISFAKADNSNEDGKLHAYEIYPMDLNNKLTVLSACETGVGVVYNGEGVFSIARGFAFAGSSSIVTSLWKVRDLQTIELMTSFYSDLGKGLSVSKAIRNSQLQYIDQATSVSAHPHFWSSFVTLGNGSMVVSERNNSKYLLGLVAGSMALIIVILYRRRSK